MPIAYTCKIAAWRWFLEAERQLAPRQTRCLQTTRCRRLSALQSHDSHRTLSDTSLFNVGSNVQHPHPHLSSQRPSKTDPMPGQPTTASAFVETAASDQRQGYRRPLAVCVPALVRLAQDRPPASVGHRGLVDGCARVGMASTCTAGSRSKGATAEVVCEAGM